MARDCKILHQFISSTFDPTNCCTLQPGLNCGNAGHATSLILKSQGPDFFVTTDLPTLINALILIPRLSYLQLSNNSLAGHIPDSIAQLTAVQYLYLDLNNFVGVVPAAIASMPSLVQLNLDDNFLIGPVPDLAGATKLNSVTMNGNCFMAGTTTWTGGSYTPATRGDCATNPIILAEEAALTASASGAASTAASGSSSTTAVFQPSPTAGISTAQDSNASSSSTTPSTSVIAAIIGVVVLAAALLVAAFVVFHRRRMGARGRTPKTPQNAEVRGGQYPDGAHSFAGVAYPPPQQRSAGSDDVSTPFITASTASSPPLFMMPSAATPAPPLRSTSTAGSNFQATWVPSHDGDAGPAGAVAMGTMRKPSTLFGKVIERGYTVGESSDGGQGAGSWITGHPGSSDGAQDPESWTTADVKSWLLRSGFDRGIADTFEREFLFPFSPRPFLSSR
ncbi:hypothetical protein HK101_000460 [Irineochytrium annulatum]|nr:hypothetical protein HK101_000460 [Irineochytrium annulatum]